MITRMKQEQQPRQNNKFTVILTMYKKISKLSKDIEVTSEHTSIMIKLEKCDLQTTLRN